MTAKKHVKSYARKYWSPNMVKGSSFWGSAKRETKLTGIDGVNIVKSFVFEKRYNSGLTKAVFTVPGNKIAQESFCFQTNIIDI